MASETRRSSVRLFVGITVGFLFACSRAHPQLSGTNDVNVSRRPGNETECTISQNPREPLRLFAACNTPGAGLFAAHSADGGVTWDTPPNSTKTILDREGDPPPACCDPSSTWDSFGNLFLAYIDSKKSNIVVLLSQDGGATFSKQVEYYGNVDQPTVVAADTSDPRAPVAVWIVWNQGVEGTGQMVAVGAPVKGLGDVGPFSKIQTIPETENCSFGDVAIAPSGAVVQVCQTPTGEQGPADILVSTDPDGLGPRPFGRPRKVAATHVGGLDFIPPQNTMSVDAEAGLAYDSRPGSPHRGRLYLVYSQETAPENNDLDVLMRYSDDDGVTWKPEPPIRVNDDVADAATPKSQYLPRIAFDPGSGSISVCWYDCRRSPENTAMEVYCTTASGNDPEPRFLPNVAVSDTSSASNGLGGYERGDYSGLVYRDSVARPIWVDTSGAVSSEQQDAPDPSFDVKTDRVSAVNPVRVKEKAPGKVGPKKSATKKAISKKSASKKTMSKKTAPRKSASGPGPLHQRKDAGH